MKELILFSMIIFLVFIPTLQAQENSNSSEIITALELYKKGAYAQAIKNLDMILIKDKKLNKDGKIDYLKGICYSKLQEFDNAAKYLELAIKKENESKDIYYELGQAYYAAQEMKKSRQNFILSIKKDHLVDSSYYYVGYISQMLEEYELAQKSYTKIENSKEGLGQAASFQMGEVLLALAEQKQEYKKVRKDVDENVLPQLEYAYEMDNKATIAAQINKRIGELKEKYDLDENKMVNGRRLSPKRFALKLKQTSEHDSNVVSEAEQSTAKAQYISSLIWKSDFSVKDRHNFDKRFVITPDLRLTYTYHGTHRSNSDIRKNDAYSVIPKIKGAWEHTLNKYMSTMGLEIELNYTAKNDEGKGTLCHSGRTWSFALDEKILLWSKGDTILKIKRKQYDAKADSSDSYTNNFSITQMITLPKSQMLMGLFNADFIINPKSESNSQNAYMTRLDYIVPSLFVEPLQFSTALAYTITDTKLQRSTRGTETSLNPSITFAYKIAKIFELSLRYDYTKNTSKDKAAYDYKKHVIGLDFEMSI
ncbi:MAG: hypothetical protein HQK49_19150 [Oligoflexia bacterium]|nr:hypothetical protein [Oligoflexia bacterium]